MCELLSRDETLFTKHDRSIAITISTERADVVETTQTTQPAPCAWKSYGEQKQHKYKFVEHQNGEGQF
jgi:hypothetical protein